jgi:hypothetical protein
MAIQAGHGINVRPYLKNYQSKKGQKHGSNSTVPTYQAQGHELKPWYWGGKKNPGLVS